MEGGSLSFGSLGVALRGWGKGREGEGGGGGGANTLTVQHTTVDCLMEAGYTEPTGLVDCAYYIRTLYAPCMGVTVCMKAKVGSSETGYKVAMATHPTLHHTVCRS